MTGRTFVARRGTTPLPNATVYDSRLSYAALGLLAVLLSRRDGAPAGYRDLEGRGLGQKATLAALRELTAAGYRHQIRRNGGGGKIVVDTLVSETPMSPDEAEAELRAAVETYSDHAAPSAARSDQRKRRVRAGGTVRRSTAPRSTVPRSGTAQVLRTPKVTSLRSVTHESQPLENDIEPCEHGEPRGAAACAICRRAAQL